MKTKFKMMMKGKHMMPEGSVMKGPMKGIKKVKRAKKFLRGANDEIKDEDKD